MATLSPSKLIVLFLLGAVAAIGASAQTFKVLAQFNGQNGAEPSSAVSQGPDGRLYGTTTRGTLLSNDLGTIFAMDASGNLTTLVNFSDALLLNFSDGFFGATDYSPLLLAPNGALLGAGGNVFYEVTSDQKFKVIHRGLGVSEGSIVEGVDGSIYGAETNGGDGDCGGSNCGAGYKIDPQGHYHLLVNFGVGNDISHPAGLALGIDGNFYGITTSLGHGGAGQAFRMTPSGSLTMLYNFCSQQNCADGADPWSLIQGSDGNLYGVTFDGGNASRVCNGFGYSASCGTVFGLSLSGEYTVLHAFCAETQYYCPEGSTPVWLIEGSDGALYGVTRSDGSATCYCGTIFRVTKDGHFTTLYQFQAGDGAFPVGLTQATSGLFYGVQYLGPESECEDGATNCGIIYSFDAGLAPFVRMVRDFGRLDQSDSIIGQGFTGATAVAFNGTPATFTVISDTFLTTNVPQGATTGYVTVTTPTGVLKSNVPFRVIR